LGTGRHRKPKSGNRKYRENRATGRPHKGSGRQGLKGQGESYVRSHPKASTAGSTQAKKSLGLIVPLIVLFALAIFAPSASAKYIEVGSFAEGSEFGGGGTGNGELLEPGQADVNDQSGDLYVADMGNNRVQRFTETSTAASYASQVAITAPSGLAVDQSDGSVYVSNATGITKLNADLTSASGWSDPGVTGALAVDPTNGDLLVADQSANLIRRFESDGTAAGAFAAERPLDLAVDAAGKVYAITSTGDILASCGGASSEVKKFSAAGSPEATTAGAGLDTPGAIAIDPDDGTILIAARQNEYWCEQGHSPEIAIFDSSGAAIQSFELPANTQYSIVPALAVRGEGSIRAYAISRYPHEPSYGLIKGFAFEDRIAPTLTIDSIDSGSITSSQATLEGTVNPNGTSTNWHFEYRIVGTSNWSSTETKSAGSGESPEDVEADISALQPNKEYEARLLATNSVGTTTSSLPNPTFTTDGAAPSVTTLEALPIRPTEATINGTVNANNSPTEYWFEWGTSDCSSSSCTSVPVSQDASAGSDFATHLLFKVITGLSPQTTYHYRLVARNASGVVAGDDASFTTPAASSACANANNLGAAQLPDCRAWEMVSPPDKNGANVMADTGRTRAAPDGNAIGFSSLAGFSGTEGFNVAGEYISRRTGAPGTNGWSTHSIEPPQASIPGGFFVFGGLEPFFEGEFSPDFTRGLFAAFSPVATPDGPHPLVDQTHNLYLRTDLSTPGAGSYQLISDCPSCTSPLPFDLEKPRILGSNTGDGTHEALTNVIFSTERKLTADAPGGGSKLYEYTEVPSEEVQTVSVDASAGQFVLTFKGQSSGDIAFDADATSVQSALNSLSSIAPGSVAVTGGPGDAGATSPYVIAFSSGTGIAGTDVPQIEVTPGTTPLSGGGESASAATRLQGGQHTRLASRIPSGEAKECDDLAAPACAGSTAINPEELGISARRRISNDGTRTFFQAGSPQGVYMREDGLRTVKLNASEKASPDEPQSAKFHIAATDGSRIFFTTGESLVDTDTNSEADLYMYDASKPASAADNLTLISAGSGGSGAVVEVMGASADGHYVYFTSNTQLIAGEDSEPGGSVPLEKGIFLWHDGSLSYIGSINSGSGFGAGPEAPTGYSRVTPDGRHLIFITSVLDGLVGHGGFEGYDNVCGPPNPNNPTVLDLCQQIFVYSAESDTLRCASCSPDGKWSGKSDSGLEMAGFAARELGGGTTTSTHLSHPLTDNGRYLFFNTGERLVPEDTNGKVDVYEYDIQSEEQHLISSGESDANSYFLDSSADGKDVFFDTVESLSGWDTDTSYDLYDARIEGGVPEPLPAPPSCQGDACQPTPPGLNDPTPSSSSFKGPGNPKSTKTNPRGCPKGKHRVKNRGKSRCVKAHNKKNHKRATNANRRAGR
jgi:hypothetical protein